MAVKPKGAKHTQPKHHDTDWTSIMVHVRAGIRTYEDIGKEFGLTKGRISQKTKELKVVRDLAPQIRARADAKVNAAALNAAKISQTTLNAAKIKINEDPARQQEVEGEVVEAGAVLMASTILRERSDVARLRALANGLVTELEKQADKAASRPGKSGADVGVKVDALSVRIENLRKLSETSKTLISLERTVLNIAPDTPIDPTKRIAEAVDNGFAGLKAEFQKKLGRA